MRNKKDCNIEITEIFMAKAGNDWSRCFHGTIRRETSADGNPVVRGKIKVNDGYISAQASDQWELGDKLDELVLMVLDLGLHSDTGKTSDIAGTPYILN
jgi:hypothetical protein